MLNRDHAADLDWSRNQLALFSRWAEELAHEIKNPFHAMVINLELVKRRAGDVEPARERAEIVESELHRVHALIDSLLKLIRPWPDTDAANVHTVLDPLLPVFRTRADLHHLDFDYRSGDGPAAVALPPAALMLTALNLVDNAFDAVAEGGWIRIGWAAEDDAVVIRITDSGPGLGGLDGDPFEVGVSGRPGRPGLGLAVSRELARQAGGSLVVEESGGDEGTTLALVVPHAG
ncbi:MAG: HAMP domain-containing sensor histidine kinase [Longimicrobiales bacterium]